MAEFLFTGMNTVIDPASLDVLTSRDSLGGECVAITNMDTLAPHGVRTRFGYTEVLSTASHSGWSDNTVAYCVAGGYLCQFNGTALTQIYPVNQNLPMSYEKVNNLVVCTNSQDYLIIDNGVISHAQPETKDFKVAPPAGSHLAFYNGRLYIASGNILYCTDPFTVDQCDTREMYIPLSPDMITGVAAVDDGLYVGTTHNVFFLSGADPYVEGGFSLKDSANYGVVPRTMLAVSGDKVPLAKSKGTVVMWTSPRGICVGGNGGQFVNVSELKVGMPQQSTTGAAFIKEYNGQIHYVTMLTDGDPYNAYIQPAYDIDEAELN